MAISAKFRGGTGLLWHSKPIFVEAQDFLAMQAKFRLGTGFLVIQAKFCGGTGFWQSKPKFGQGTLSIFFHCPLQEK